RLRRSGAKIFADLTIRIQHTATSEQAHHLAHQAEEAVRSLLPGADVVVHVEPIPGSAGDLVGTVRAAADRHGLAAHAIRLVEQQGQQTLELHLEVPPELSLEQAHEQATACENELHQTLPAVARIVSHLEPSSGGHPTQALPPQAEETELLRMVHQVVETYAPQAHGHDLQVLRSAEGISVSFHCTLPGQTGIREAHDLAEMLEKHLRSLLPGLGRVVIHVEPET
ncbi:MAG TPA: cation transporter dimerization domain-containing protein, partial [Thermoguttaceae bacterium]|nr:cation transporter dimerization domain-containing protein [Thermoguttaceae bacterium]